MKLFGKSNLTDTDPATLTKSIRDARERLNVFSESIRALFLFVREYTLDICEIDAEDFKKQLEALQEKFQPDETTKTIATQFNINPVFLDQSAPPYLPSHGQISSHMTFVLAENSPTQVKWSQP